MKNLFKIKVLLAGLVLIFCFYACIKDLNPGNGSNSGKKVNVNQVNLVSDTVGYGAARTDTNLLNAWGIAAPPNGPLW
ncbi:MAG: hypothetical protein JWQ66_4515, partial [Mucilaginibacter sp.]|nr:hypothetical protein [Mucilaginibacter sp.]